jgi:recombination protein RecA
MGVVGKSGAFLRYGETMLGQGRANAISYLKENPDLAEKIKKEVLAKTRDGNAKPMIEVGVEDNEEDDEIEPEV